MHLVTSYLAMTLTYFILFINFVVIVQPNFIAEKQPVKNLVDSGEIGSLLERQIPEDIIYDLTGRKMLITRDDQTDVTLTFLVKNDEHGFPVVHDPETGHKYLVKSSIISKDVEIYRMMVDKQGNPIVADWETRTINRIKLNKYKEVELVAVPQSSANFKFGDLDLKID